MRVCPALTISSSSLSLTWGAGRDKFDLLLKVVGSLSSLLFRVRVKGSDKVSITVSVKLSVKGHNS
jgi:hypothetical protein